MKTNKRQQGFSLLELLIVIAVVGVLLTVVAPLISSTITRYKARAEARELVSQFKKAKLEAAKHYRDVCINFLNVGGTNCGYRIFVNVDRDTNNPHTYDPGDILLTTHQLNRNVQLQTTNFTNNQAGYNSRGLPLQTGNIVLGASNSRTYTIVVSNAGRAVIQ